MSNSKDRLEKDKKKAVTLKELGNLKQALKLEEELIGSSEEEFGYNNYDTIQIK